MFDRKNLVIHTVRLVHSAGSASWYETKDSPAARDNAMSEVERDGDVGLWIRDPRGRTFWTPLSNALEIEWGKAKAEGPKGKAA